MDDLDLGQTLRGFAAGQKVFGRYTLVRQLGRGGMGVVWLARDEKLEQDVALKFLPEMVANDPAAVSDLKRETRRSLQLTHPHIVRIHDFVEDSRLAAVSMEFVDGASLSLRRLEQPGQIFEPAALRTWAQQLCEALEYAHTKAKIVHRDLKPANLMVDAHGDLKVADFGISATLSDTTTRVSKQASSSGTPVYMSPQQMMGEKPAATDDIYSFGATLYELLTGKPPFYSGNVLLQVQNKVPPSLAARRVELGVTVAGAGGPGIPAEWEATIAACLAKQPEDRPQSAAEVWGRLNGVGPDLGRGRAAASKLALYKSEVAVKSKLPLVLGLAAVLAVAGWTGWYYGIAQPAQRRLAEQQRQEEARRVEVARLEKIRQEAEEARQEQERQAEQKRQAEMARLEAARAEAEQACKAAEERAAAVVRERDEQARRVAEAAAQAERERQAEADARAEAERRTVESEAEIKRERQAALAINAEHESSAKLKSENCFIGIQILQALTPEIKKGYGVETGAIVTAVTPDSAAYKAGIRQGDVIVRFDGMAVEDAHRLKLMVGRCGSGAEVKIVVVRAGAEKAFTLKLGTRPSDDKALGVDGPSARSNNDERILNGAVVVDISKQARDQFNMPPDLGGVLVVDVEPGSAAATAGLLKGDVIREINHQLIKTAKQAVDLNTKLANKRTLLMLWRNGRKLYALVAQPKSEGK